MNKITLLIHGPFDGNFLDGIYKNYKKVPKEIQEIVIVCYNHDKNNYVHLLQTMSEWNVKLISVKDTLNPGFFNINRQILTVKAGLDVIHSDNFVIKLRNDQCINFKKLFSILKVHNFFRESPYKIISTNCYTRKDRLYHPSDMFLCGFQKSLKTYYSAPLMDSTHLEHMMYLQELDQQNSRPYHSLSIVPESYLFRNYLKKQKWLIRETYEDSLKALQKYIFLINSWNIDFRWNKPRTPFCPPKSIILPCRFKLRPFNGVAKEKARCFSANKINQSFLTPRDIYFLVKSRVLFYFAYSSNPKKIKLKCKKQLLRIFLLLICVFPNFLVRKITLKINNKIADIQWKIASL